MTFSDRIGPQSPVTDALFTLRLAESGDTPATVSADDVRAVPYDGDALFSAVLRALVVWGRAPEHTKAMKDVVMQRLDVWIDSTGPLKLDWDATGPKASDDEKSDIQKLRKIVADRFKMDSNFYDYYTHSASNANEMRDAYTSLLAWPYANPLSNEQKAAMNRQLYALVQIQAMRGTPKPVKQGIGVARKYAADLDHPCVKECLDELQALYDAPDSRRRETQNAVVATTEMMGQKSPFFLLDVIADIMGVHIDVFFYDRKSGGIDSAKCTHSFGPDPQDWVEERDGSLAEEYEAAGLGRTFPLLELLYAKDTKRFTYNVPSSESSRQGEGQRPLLDREFDDNDTILRFYEAILNGDGGATNMPKLPPFKDPCKEDEDEDGERSSDDASDDDESDGDEEYVEEGEEEEEEEDEDEDEVVEETPVADADNAAAATMTDGDDNARADPAMRARTSTAMIDSDDEDEVADGDLEPQPAVPIRLGPFAEPDYVLREVVMSEEQEEWARDRMRNAHAHIIEHLSSRPGYAEIMLMTDPTGDALAEQYVPTGGETAAVKDNNKQNWAWLKSHEKVGELSRQMEGDLARDIVQTISIKRHDSPKYHKIKRESNDDAERAEAEDWLREWRDDKKRRDGMQMALRLMYGVSAFRNHDAGPWVALLAWWLRLDDRAQLQPLRADEARSTVDDAQGRELCFMHSNTKSTGPWLESASKKYWDGLWVFMDRLYYWLRQDHQSVINEAVALKNDPAFTEETSWANLGVRLNAGRR